MQKDYRSNTGLPGKSGEDDSYSIPVWIKVLRALACSWPRNIGPKQMSKLNHMQNWPAESSFIQTYFYWVQKRLQIINNTENCATCLWSAPAPQPRGCSDHLKAPMVSTPAWLIVGIMPGSWCIFKLVTCLFSCQEREWTELWERVKHSEKYKLEMPSPLLNIRRQGRHKMFCISLYLKKFRSVLFLRKKTIRDINQHNLHSSEEAGLSRKGLSYLRM